jgi:hypothetical protein
MLIGCSGIVCDLEDAFEDFGGGHLELLCRSLLRSRNCLDEGFAIKGVQLVKHDNRNHEPVTELWRGDRSANTDDRVEIQGAGLRTDRFHQPLKIAWVAGVKDVGLQALNRQDPAQLTGEVTIFGFEQNIMCDLLVGLSGGLRPAGGLVEFFFDRETWKASHDLTDGVDMRDRGGRGAGGAGGTGGQAQRLLARWDRPARMARWCGRLRESIVRWCLVP